MRRSLVLLSALGLLSLAACGGPVIEIKNSNGKVVGTIETQETHTATLLNVRGDVRGKVRGTVIRDDTGKNIGTLAEKNGTIVITDSKDNPVGSLTAGKDCYGKGNDKLGTITPEADSYAAAAACLVFFLQ